MTTRQITTATAAEVDQCIAVMSLAFSNNPGVRWMYPDPRQYMKYFRRFVRAFGGRARAALASAADRNRSQPPAQGRWLGAAAPCAIRL